MQFVLAGFGGEKLLNNTTQTVIQALDKKFMPQKTHSTVFEEQTNSSQEKVKESNVENLRL